MELFEKNLAALEQRYPLLAEKIKKFEIDKTAGRAGIETAANGMQIPWVKGDNRVWHLNSRQDPQMAAELYAKRYQIRDYGIYFIFGFSDGRCAQELLKNCNDTNLVVICEPDLEVFAISCHYMDFSGIVSDTKTLFYFYELEPDMSVVMSRIINYTRIKLLEFCILPGYDVLYHEQCEAFMDGVIEQMRNETVNKSTSMTFERLIPHHKNMEQLHQALEPYDISDRPCIIVSAGPSLDKNIRQLKQIQGKAFTIVVDAALRTALKAGIRPDLVCTVDARVPERFFEGVDLTDVIWAYTGTTRKSIAENYGKDVFYYGTFYQKWNETLKEELGYPIPSFASGGCVSSEAFVLALYLGFRTIVLIGQDLAFTGGSTHTKEATVGRALSDEQYKQRRKIVEVEGIDGTMLDTDFQMWFYKQWFEKVIKMNQDQIKVIDATEGGAKIEGTIVQTLAETIEQECRGELDIYEIEKQIPPAFTSEQQKRLLKQLHGMKKEVADFTEKIDGMIKRQEALVDAMEKHLMPQEKLLEELRRINQQYEEISQETILNFISMYAHKEEYELGDIIYTEETMGPKELLEQGLRLYKGYHNGARMLAEDIEEILMKD